jgi:hypothetical protein
MKEYQKLTQWWVKLLLIIPVLVLAVVLMLASLEEPMIEFTDSEFVTMIVCFLIMLLVAYLILKVELRTEISQEGIHLRFIPFHGKSRIYKWSEIENIAIRKYKPISEYGGWGIRFSLSGKGRAFNVLGNMGIQLEFKDGKKLLIGTQKPEKVESVLRKLNKFV